jgi:GntR family transcriptional regulator/MocR family aminotransferase
MMELLLTLDRSRRTPISIQIAHGVRDAIFSQRLPPGARLPPTRELAQRLHVSRTTVIEAYDWLVSEGYAQARQGSGTYLTSALSLSPDVAPQAQIPPRRTDIPVAAPVEFDFRPGLPALDLFPRAQWKSALARSLDRAEANALGYGPVEGLPRLRQLIAEYIARTRGLPVSAERVVITIGVAQALDLLLRVLAPIQKIAIEEPSAEPVRRLIKIHGIPILPVPVDDQGMQVDLLESASPAPTAVHVVPSHQYPTGVVMSLERRLSLLGWAADHDAVILEDDYDSEFRFDQSPPISLAALDAKQRVVYIGTFSKTLFPALRMGFCVLPERLMDGLLSLKWFSDRCVPVLEQLALIEWLESGIFERHVKKMRRIYSLRRETLANTIAAQFGRRASIQGVPAGMHIMVSIDTTDSEEEILERALDAGIRVYPASTCYSERTPERPALILGYGMMDEDAISRGVRRLAAAIHK